MTGRTIRIVWWLLLPAGLVACRATTAPPGPTTVTSGVPEVLAVESFLADIARNVAGDRLTVETLMPLGLDPHAFEPTPRDVAKVALPVKATYYLTSAKTGENVERAFRDLAAAMAREEKGD